MTGPNIPGGYIIISRNIVDSEIWHKPPLYIKVWVYLLTMAQHSNYKKLKRGQLVTSIPEIMEACSWMVGYRKMKPKKDQVYQVIEWLRKQHEGNEDSNLKPTMITTTKVTHGLLINIEKYDFYQTSKNYDSNNENNTEEVTKAKRGQRQPDNINKNDKNDKNDNYVDFDKGQSQNPKITAFQFYEQNGFGTLSSYISEKIGAYIDDLNDELVVHAMKLALENNVRNWSYVEKILIDWSNKQIKALSDVEADRLHHVAKRKSQKKEVNYNGQNATSYGQDTSTIPQYITKRSSHE